MTEEFKRYVPTLKYFGKPFLIFKGIFLACLGAYVPAAILSCRVPFSFVISSGGPTVFIPAHYAFNPWILLPLPVVIASLILMIITTHRFAKVIINIRRVRAHDDEILEHGYVITYEGAPGKGKTLSMTYDAILRCEQAWCELKLEKLCAEGFMTEPDWAFPDSEAAWHYLSVKQAVDYYEGQPDKIPLLLANYAIEKAGRFSGKLKAEHLLQKERAPERAVMAYDEVADVASNTRSSASKHGAFKTEEKKALSIENKDLAEFCSKERHYGEWRISIAEQDGKEVFIGVRRVVSLTRSLIKLEKICEPDRLIRKQGKIESKVLKKDDCTERQAGRIAALKERASKIGYIKITYYDEGSYGKISDFKPDFYILPKNTGFKYATRGYEFEYPCLHMPIAIEAHESMYQTPEPLWRPSAAADKPIKPPASKHRKKKIEARLREKYEGVFRARKQKQIELKARLQEKYENQLSKNTAAGPQESGTGEAG